jgi:MoaA/NifB/PqqE/SkfB family radical SAM enzyme
MRTAEFDSLWRDIATIRPEKVTFTGGEPLLRSDLMTLLAGMRNADPERHVRLCLNSNGQLVTAEVAKELVGLVDEVRVSIDGMRDQNDALRGCGSFNAAMFAFDNYYSVGFEPKALITVTAITLPDLEQLLSFLVERGIRQINVNQFRPIGRGAGHEQWRVERRAVEEVILRVLSSRGLSLSSGELLGDEFQSTCGVGKFLNIMPNGDVYPCHVLTAAEFRCGNVRTESLTNICREGGLLGSLAALNFEDLVSQDESISSLRETGTCMGSVFSETSHSSVWRRNIPLFQIQPMSYINRAESALRLQSQTSNGKCE